MAAGPLADKVAIVAGATGGIGVATVERLIEDGATVVASGRNQARLAELDALSDRVFTRKSDVSNEAEAKDLVAWTVETLGRVDLLFNGAGIVGESNLIEDQTLENFEKVMSINVTGTFLMMKYTIPAMRLSGGGSIINVSSAAGVQGGRATMPVYCASKHAVIGLTRVGAKAHAGEGIRINVIVPGQIDTDMLEAVEADAADGDPIEARKKVIAAIPAGRYGDTSEVAALTAFLCRDDAKFINGSIYSIDGGFTPF